MKVRRATRADAEAMARVHWLSSNTAYGRNGDFERRLASTRNAFELDGVRLFLAEEDGQAVGVAVVAPDELYALYVHPDWWGTGAGQLLIDQVHATLSETCDEARLTVLAENSRARRFYERNGWELESLLTEPHFGGIPTEVAEYRKHFTRLVAGD